MTGSIRFIYSKFNIPRPQNVEEDDNAPSLWDGPTKNPDNQLGIFCA